MTWANDQQQLRWRTSGKASHRTNNLDVLTIELPCVERYRLQLRIGQNILEWNAGQRVAKFGITKSTA